MPDAGIVPGDVAVIGERARTVLDADAVRAGIDRLAVRLTLALGETNPLLVAVLQGGLYLSGQLMARLRFPLQQASVQVSRYGNATEGGALRFLAPLSAEVTGRTVLLVDDIFDAGITLNLLASHLRERGAARVVSAVLVRRQRADQTQPPPDFHLVECGEGWLIGCGMDYRGYWRNLPEIRMLQPGDT
ncbi:MAG: hypoxanthine-guanine phosphoribosyltransferase [Pseudomonadales bacterium]|nr:hypoxanthine-guanine phosphoribosyltransferase [Pseudomonadales bacterium]MCP5183827.1 hypoxanthine-guanine phosphoribosyltransferase [Pseudomonadales bacterium]